MSVLTETLGALRAAGKTAYDTDVPTSPPASYIIVTDRDLGLAEAHRQSPTAHWTRTTVDVRVVARTINGLRQGVADVRATLTGRRLPSGAILRELEASPPMTTGTTGDRRHEAVLAYRTTAPTKGAIRP